MGMPTDLLRPETSPDVRLCAVCGIPLDAQHFDESGFRDLDKEPLAPMEVAVLARFEVHPQYCGVLQHFYQFSNLHARNPAEVITEGLQWQIRVNGHPLFPYLALGHIVSPWGSMSYPMAIRLDESARIELVARRVTGHEARPKEPRVKLIGGRLVGRYWYNRAYGDVARRRA